MPRPDMLIFEPELTVTGALDLAIQHGYSRVPVMGTGEQDHVVGLVYTKDLMRAEREGRGEELVTIVSRDVRIIPENKPVARLMREMQAQKFHLAIVADEYGNIVGLCTLEDCLEELVGEIVDEFDEETAVVEQLPDGTYRVDGKANVSELNDLLGVDLPDEEWDTVAGFVFGTLEHVPDPGEEVEYQRLAVRRRAGRGSAHPLRRGARARTVGGLTAAARWAPSPAPGATSTCARRRRRSARPDRAGSPRCRAARRAPSTVASARRATMTPATTASTPLISGQYQPWHLPAEADREDDLDDARDEQPDADDDRQRPQRDPGPGDGDDAGEDEQRAEQRTPPNAAVPIGLARTRRSRRSSTRCRSAGRARTRPRRGWRAGAHRSRRAPRRAGRSTTRTWRDGVRSRRSPSPRRR